MDTIKHHGMYYMSLGFILVMGILLAFTTDNRILQMTAIVLTALLYVGWGVVHHWQNHDLRAKIVVEYVLMATLGITVALFFLRGGS